MKTIKMLALAATLFATQAGTALAQSNGSAPQRGTVQVDGAASKAVVAGPVTIHAYSQFAGSSLYTVKAVTGTDLDCAAGRGDETTLASDSVQSFTVGAGRIACIAGSSARNIELLWHAQPDAPTSATTLIARR
jgi:hypothetical protein